VTDALRHPERGGAVQRRSSRLDAVDARVAVVQKDILGTFVLGEIAGRAFGIGGALVLGQRFALVVEPDDPAPGGGRFNVDGRCVHWRLRDGRSGRLGVDVLSRRSSS
jgi:hypothetical protein